MIVSYNEIVVICRKVLEGMGFAPGDYTDAADHIGWLAQHGLDGVRDFHSVLPTLKPQRPSITRQHSRGDALKFKGDGHSLLIWGWQAVDSAYVHHLESGATTTVEITNCRHAHLLLPYWVRCAQRGLSLQAQWERNLVQIDHRQSHLPTLVSNSDQLTQHLRITFSAEPLPPLPLSASSQTTTPQTLAARFAQHRDNGIPVPDPIWADLTERAKAVLVPETEESRNKGAGEQAE